MNKMAALTVSLLFSGMVNASDCFDLAGRDYKIDPDLLRAIAWNESKFNQYAVGNNYDSSVDTGIMQINSQHDQELYSYGITRHHLKNDACLNIYTGAFYLAIAFKKWGVSWVSVGAYNAGFKDSPKQAYRRYIYAEKIHRTYKTIKLNKKKPLTYPIAKN
ncbi:transglycosylase SLT domain-containing protein (plasmid) [Serratia sp. JSRIV001]|uniref:transglycosylase SLT domain-containing protein n=1 Tax=unclassified Serratia (in: enterobacteria) TaxID=2647522 RepID=UPI001CBACC35|nr:MULTISPECIES: transglycosylase SLT domain-containing protein [unclassified Serratia (in: enterobacteria)]UAN48843.1 transglycosylase SLT domain-containing protein [Serratia sp. JSRIV001]UAN54500.1 transglycosylase SLT domain-containing protein [Serratia sp. JSRIV002]UAN60509.1 transglycosylase SLT domain-containing protein [Serratia sp. JSRIV004]